MKIIILSLLLALFSQIKGDPIYIEVYRCEEISSTTCVLKNVVIDNSTPFLPKSLRPNEVTELQFVSSNVTTLTHVFCETFPNLKIFKIKGVSLKTIQPGAFDKCQNLKEIHLQDNKLTQLDENLFSQNKELTKIILNNNKLKNIPVGLFRGLTKLQTIDLCNNKLLRLPPETFDGLGSMQNLEVRSNPMLSFEIEDYKRKMPNLKFVLTRDLELTCDRMEEIDAFCKSNLISPYLRDDFQQYHSKSNAASLRSRIYPVKSVDGSECLNEEQYEREVFIRETLPNFLKIKSTHDQENFDNTINEINP